MVENIQQKADDRTSVSFKLDGKDAKRFADYMERERIYIVSVAARKLMLERLDQLDQMSAGADGGG